MALKSLGTPLSTDVYRVVGGTKYQWDNEAGVNRWPKQRVFETNDRTDALREGITREGRDRVVEHYHDGFLVENIDANELHAIDFQARFGINVRPPDTY